MVTTKLNKERILDEFNESLEKSVVNFLRDCPDDVLNIPLISMAIAGIRIDALQDDDIKIQEMDAQNDLVHKAIEHNLSGLKGKSTLGRPIMLSSILRSIGHVQIEMKNKKVLTVGPRTEAEIFALVAAGFDPVNIRGLDLMSYSPKIDVGDMHDMPYEDDSFDIILLGWVLAYSNNPVKAVREARRVAKKDAVFAVGCEYSPLSFEELKSKGTILGDDIKHYEKLSDILDLFEGDVGTIWFQDEIHPDLKDQPGSVVTVFQRKLNKN